MIKKISLILFIVLSTLLQVEANNCYPEKSNSKLVYDESNVLSDAQEQELNNYLINVSNQTSNQIVVLILDDLCGDPASAFSVNIGHDWGVGRDGKDNGIVLLVKPTNNDQGKRETFIAVGYGLEGIIPDATAKTIVDQEMIPNFKKKDFYTGIASALNVIVPLVKQEFDYVAYDNKISKRSKGIPFLFIIVIIIMILSKVFGARSYAQRNNISFWSAIMMGNIIGSSFGGSGRSGGYNNFTSGGGGFGGFGGGGFGGGGAGGDW